MAWDPITRIVGSLGIYTKIDFGQGKVAECHSTSSIFRGYSIFMKGKDPRDAHFITSRICGICGDNHATCSCYAQNMAYGVHPPALGEQIVNLGEAAEYMFDHNIFQENLVGVDFCEKMVAETNPGVLEQANRTEAPHAADHGYKTIGDIMRSLNPFSGEFYREALQVSRYTREMFCLMEGRHVHPSTLYPGGVGTTATIQLFTDYLHPADALRGVHEAGRADARRPLRLLLRGAARLRGGRPAPRPARLLGRLPGPRRLQLRLPRHDRVGPGHVRHARRRRRRQARHQRPRRHQPRHPHPARQLVLRRLGGPGDVRDHGPARATRSTAATRGTSTRIPQPQKRDFDDKYSWVMSPRWFDGTDHLALDTGGGPIARLWSTALSGLVDIGYVKATGPQRGDPPAEDGAQARGHASSGRSRSGRTPSSATGPAPTSRRTRRRPRSTSSRRRWPRCAPGSTKTWEPFEVPDEGIGCGFTEAVRGVLSHHMVIKGGKIANYHPYPPTPWNANPRDVYGTPGPVRGRGDEHADLRGERPRQLQGHRHHAHGAQLRPVPAVRRAHVPRQGQGAEEAALADPGRRPDAGLLSRRPEARWRPQNLRAVGDRIEQLLDELRATRRPARVDRAEELLRLVTELYGAGLERVSSRSCGTRRPSCSATLVDDELVASLLVVHGLHPDDLRDAGRARRSSRCGRSSPSHGGDVELLDIDDDAGAVHLRLLGQLRRLPVVGGHAAARRRAGHRRGRAGDRRSSTSRSRPPTPRPSSR